MLSTTTSGGNVVDNSSNALGNFGVSTGAGNPANLPNVNAGTTELSQTNGFIFIAGQTTGLVATTEATLDRTANSLDSISWYNNRNTGANGTPVQRAAVQIGSQWYVSDATQAFTANSSNAGFTAANGQVTFAITGATLWDALTATAGSAFARGAAVTLPTGDVTAMGIFYDVGLTPLQVRFDAFEVAASPTPEPASLGTLAIGGATLLRRRPRA